MDIAREMLEARVGPVLATRADGAQVDALCGAFDGASVYPDPERFPDALKTVLLRQAAARFGRVGILTAGSTDLPVAEEARATLEACGIGHAIVADIGVAGIHRLLDKLEQIKSYDALIVVAGMEGALASVVGGLVETPVIAVPTSVGYGASAGGTTAMMAMLASCAPGISVVGIDNGFGAACAAARITGLFKAESEDGKK